MVRFWQAGKLARSHDWGVKWEEEGIDCEFGICGSLYVLAER